MLSDCLFGCCQCFWCSYFIRCIVPHCSSITLKILFCFCWSFNFCKVSLNKTSCCYGIFSSFSCPHFFGHCGSLEAFHIFVSLICAAIWLTDSIFWLSKRVFVLFLSDTRAPSRILSILLCNLCAIVMYRLFGCSSVSLTLAQSYIPYLSLNVHKLSTTLRSLFLNMWFEILLTMKIFWFKDDGRPPLPQKGLFHFWSLSITNIRSLADLDFRISWLPTLIFFG